MPIMPRSRIENAGRRFLQRLLQMFIAKYRARGLHVLPIPKRHYLRRKADAVGQRFFRRLPPTQSSRDGNKSAELRFHL